MEAQQSLGEGWAIVAMFVALPILFFLFFKAMTAKTRRSHFAYFAACAAIMLVLFGFLTELGLMFSAEQMQQLREAKKPDPAEALANVPAPALVAFIVAGIIWIGGGNWIVIRQTLKAGRPWWSFLIPFTPPFRDMDRRSWVQLALLMFLGFVVVSVGLELSQPVPRPVAEESLQN